MSEGLERFIAGNPEKKYSRHIDTIRDFVFEHDLSSKDLEIAYQVAMGLTPEESEGRPFSEEVYQLAGMMDVGMKEGLPVNILTEIIGVKAQYEQIPSEYYNFIDVLKVSENEKAVLKSIVEKIRAGELEIFDKKSGRKLDSVEIPKDVGSEEEDRRVVAALIASHLQYFSNADIEIIFSTE